MRRPSVDARVALVEQLKDPGQVPPPAAGEDIPPYIESFLAHLRLLVGVPYEYLVPDPRLLPPESMRFFYLDRSFSDRLVDGAVAVGKAGTREQAHHQERDAGLRARLDVTERVVRVLQRGLAPFIAATASAPTAPAGVITGFILRSAAVAGWPHMDVRAFDTPVADDAPAPALAAHALRVLRLERIAPAVLLALFEGVPRLVWLEEPLTGVPLGVTVGPEGVRLFSRPALTVPFRAGGKRVVHVASLRRAVLAADPALPRDGGGGVLAEAVLGRAHRQRFEGRRPRPPAFDPDGFGAGVAVASRVADPAVAARLGELFQ
jgi:hypothetical protein